MKVLSEAISKAVEELEWETVSFSVEHPKDESHGDHSTNAALVLAKKLGKQPREVAEILVTKLQSDTLVDSVVQLERIEIAGPGFINFWLKDGELSRLAQEAAEDRWEKPLSGKKYSVEYTDPNPFKEFHIGHLYSNLIGESIARLYEANGATVWRGDFYGDVGMHIAKSVWGMMKKMEQEGVKLTDLEEKPIKERQQFMGQGYAEGSIQFDEDPSASSGQVREEIKDINYMVYVASQEVLVKTRGWKPLVDYRKYIEGHEDKYPLVRDVYQAGLRWSLAYFETYYQRLGTKFDGYYPESYVGELGLKVVEKGLEKGVLELGEGGAVVYKGEQDGLHTRVFRNAMGLPTYEAKDLGLVKAKYADFPFDYSLNVFGKEIDEYYKVVKKALEKIEPELGKKQEHLAHGMVNVPEGKMSSRKGNVITVEWLLNEAASRAKALMKDSKMSEGEVAEVAEQVGQAAVKYALLKSNVGDNVTFDFGRSVTFEGASGPYLQYTYARAKSVLAKAGSARVQPSHLESVRGLDPGKEERGILSWIARYPEVVVKAAEGKAPSELAGYLYELAQRFNSFYNGNKIAGDENRLALTSAVSEVLKRGLSILGIQAPEQM